MRALFQAHYLGAVSKKPSVGEFWKRFDLIVGTSAGAIVAACLTQNMLPEEIAALFEGGAADAFPIKFWTGFRYWIGLPRRGALVTNRGLHKLLIEKLGKDTTLRNCKPMLAVTATELNRSKIRVFSPITQDLDADINLVDAVMASTALPGAFPEYSIWDPGDRVKREYVDGGLWANAPLLAGVGLAVQHGDRTPRDVRVVSIGTAGEFHTSSAKDYAKVKVNSKAFYDNLFNMTFSAAEHVAYEAVTRLVGDDNLLHVDERLPEPIKAWEVKKALDSLPDIAKHAANNDDLTNRLRKLIP